MTLPRVGAIAVLEQALSFISDVRKSEKALKDFDSTSKKTASGVTKSQRDIANSAKVSADALTSADQKVIKSLESVEKARIKALAATNALNAALSQGPARNAQGRFVPTGDPSTASGAGSPQQLSAEAAARSQLADASSEQAKAFRELNTAQNELKALGGQVATFGPASEAVAQMSASVKALNPQLVAMAAAERAAAGGAEELEEDVENADKKTGSLGQTLLKVAKAAAIAFISYKALSILKSIIQDTVDLGVQTFKLQQEIGGTAEEVSGLIFAFKQFGIEPSRVANVLGIFSRNLALVAENAAGLNTRGQQSTRVLAALGITVLQANGQLVPTIDIIKQLSDRFAELSDENLKAGIASQLFGQNASDILPLLNLGAAGIEQLMERAKELGVVLTEEGANAAFAFAQSQRELEAALTGVKIAIGQELLPLLADLTTKLTTFLTANRAAIGRLAQGAAQGLSQFASNAVLGLKRVNDLLSFIPANERAITVAIGAIGAALVLAFGPAGAAATGLALIISQLDKIENFAQRGRFAKPPSRIDALREQQTELQRQLEADRRASIRQPGAPGTLLGGVAITAPISELMRSILDAVDATSGELENRIEVEKELAAITRELTALEEAEAQAKRDADAAKEAADRQKEYEDALAGVSDETRQAISEMHDLSNAFRDSSLAAGQVRSLTEELGLFGEVSQRLAERLVAESSELTGIDPAILAGNLQGFDAVQAALSRTSAENFNYAKTLATVASAAQAAERGVAGAAQAFNQLVAGLARSALSATQAALNSIFSRPTREVADLNVQKAEVNLLNARRSTGVDPSEAQIKRLNSQAKSIDDEIKAIKKANQAANKAIDEANKLRRRQDKLDDIAFRQANDAAKRAARAQLDQLKLMHLLERQAFERMIDGIQRLIEANNKSRSDLQESFLKNNEALQRQINEAIGRGDTSTALSLVDQQRAQAKAYQAQDVALRKNGEQLEFQRKQLELDNREKERQRQLAEALNQATVDQTLAAIDAAEAARQVAEAFEEDAEAVEQSTDALEAQKEALAEQAAKLKELNSKQTEQIDAIQRQIDIYEAETEVLRAQAEAADATLISQKEQARLAAILTEQLALESEAIVEHTKLLGENLNPEVEEAFKAFKAFEDALAVGTDKNIRQKFLREGIDYAGLRASIFATALISDEEAVRRHVLAMLAATRDIKELVLRAQAAVPPSPVPAPQDNKSNQKPKTTIPGQGVGAAEGGIYSSPTLLLVGETHQKELVLPLERPARAQQLLSRVPQNLLFRLFAGLDGNTNRPYRNRPGGGELRMSLPPSLLANMLQGGGGQSVFAPNISVRGETLDTMEATAIRLVRQAFRDASTTSRRGGSMLTQGLGPSR